MMRCNSCHADFNGDLDKCPLCGDPLEGSPSPAVFPINEIAKPKKLARRCLLIITAAILALTVAAGTIMGAGALATCVACAVVLLNYAFIRNVVVHSPSLLRVLERCYLVLMAVALLYLLASGNLSVSTFVIPLLSLMALLSNTLLLALFRNQFVHGFAKYLLFDLVLGMVPLILLAAGIVTEPSLAVASAVAAGVLLALLLALTHAQLAAEMRKLFNI